MRELTEAGYVSLVELTREKTFLHATLYNDKADMARHRDVQLAWLVKPAEKHVYGIKNCPVYMLWKDVHLFSLEVTEVGKILRVIA